MQFRIITEAASTPVSVEEFRNHTFLFDDTSQDAMLEEMLLAAQKYVANYTGEFITSTEIVANVPTLYERTTLPHYKLVSEVITVQYYDSNNTLTTVPTSDYFIEEVGKQQVIVYTGDSLTTFSKRSYPITITYDAGYPTATDVPLDIRNAIMLLANELYDHRGNTTTDNIRLVNLTAERLLSSYRRH